jgi:hypothetical protein
MPTYDPVPNLADYRRLARTTQLRGYHPRRIPDSLHSARRTHCRELGAASIYGSGGLGGERGGLLP